MGLLDVRRKAITELELWKKRIEDIDDTIFEAVKDKVPQTGSATMEFEGEKISITIPKVVKWDQLLLKRVAAKIQASGDDPETYIRYELKVLETTFKTWPEQVQAIFLPARTVMPGKRKIEVKK